MADELDELTRALDRSLSTAGVAADDDLRRAVDTESKLYTGRTAAIDELTRSAELGKLTKQGGYLWPDEEKTLADLEQAATLPDVERLASKRKQTFQQVQQARERERELRQEDSVIGRSVTALRDTFVPKPATARVPTPEQAIETARSQPATPTHALQKFALPAEEEAFQSWYHQTFPQLHPNPDDPRHFYDYRAYFKAILAGEADDPTPDLTDRDPETGQPRLHMDSRFKLSGHPREYLDTPQGRLHTPTGRVTPSASSSDVDLELPEIQVTAPPLEQKPLVFTDRAGNVTRTVVPTPEDALNLTGQPTSEGFASAFAKGMQGGMYQVGAAAAGTVQRLTPDSMVGDVAEAFERAAREYGPNRVMAAKPWFERLTNPEYLGNLLGNAAIQTAPSLAAFMGGTLAGGPVVGTVAMAGTIYLQTAGEAYREALKGFAAQGLSPEDAEVKAYYASGFAGLVSAAVNALAVPASMVEPFKAKLTNLVLQWGLNVGVDTADQLTQNILAASTYDPTRSITEGLPETVVASGLMSAPETMGAVKSVISGPAVARERIPTPEEAIQPTAPKKPSGPMTQAPFGVEPTPKTGLTPAQAATRLQHLQQLVNPIPPELQVQTPDQRPPFLIKQPSVSPSPEAIPIAPSAMPIEPSELTDLGQSQATPTERPVSPELGVQTSPVSEPVTLPELAATTPKKPESYQPAFPPRHEMPPEQNAELLARAQKAQADLDLSIGGQGGYNTEFDVGPGQGEITGFKSANADWHKEATNPEHPNEPALSRKRVQVAVQKILHDQGRDVGKDVDRVKQLLLGDPEFMGSPFAPKTEEDWRGLIDEALAPYQPSSGLPPELEGLSIFQPKPKPTTRKESRSEPEFPTPEAAIEEAAHEAATSPTNALPEPTQPQKEAGNYKKGHVRIAGLDISIENPQGSTRSGTDASGKPWSVEMQSHYGYIRGTKGKDKDHLDVFIKPGTTDDYRGTVYVVDQNQPGTKTFDEHKIVLGASSIEEAKRLYLDNYTKDWTGLGAISAVEMPQFKAWLQSGQTTKPFHRPENSYRQSEKTQPAGQQAISVPPPTIGERPLIAREPTPEEAPLLSKGSQVPTPEQVSLDEAPLSIPQPEEAIAPSTPTYATAAEKIGTFIQQELQAGRSIAPESLFRLADTEFGGTRAQGAYQEKDAYDAMELGVNKYLSEVGGIRPDGSAQSAQETVDWIRLHILDLIPTQRLARTEEQNEFQQFSTPPDLGFVMNWVANIAGPQAPDSIRGADVVLEPSAGLGGLAVFAKNTGATVYVNELSPRRAALLQQLDFDRTFTENAEQLNNVLPKDVRPTVIIMNPPFSSTAGRKEGERASLNAIAHLGQALKRLEPNGRLVALVGKPKEGMKPSQGFATALSMLGNQYAFRAQIGVSGKRYQKYGTTFDNQILVFDKIAPTGQAPLSAFVDDVRDAIPLLKEIRDARRYSTADRSTQPASPEPRSEAVAPGSRRRRAEGGPTVPPPTDVVGGDRGEPALGERTGENLEGSTTRPALDDVRSEEPGLRPAPDGGRREPVRRRHESRPEHPPERPEPEGRGLESPGRLSQRDQRPAVPRSDVSDRVTVESTPEETAPEPGESATDNAVFDTYRPKRLKIDGAKGHPAKLVESAAMAAVDPPPATYQLALPKSLIESGKLSLAQLESTVYAGQAHAQHLPDGTRKGFFVGDGTGVGKGREVSAVILDNWMQGRTKAIWVSKNDDLLASASRDWTDLGQSADQLFGHDKIKPSGRIDRAQGILFTTYNKLAIGLDATAVGGVKQKEGKSSRLQQIVEWVGKDFDGVIAFDEAHEMRNNVTMKGARGAKKPAMKALAGVELQRALPNARIVYFSATGGIEPSDFGYAERLGMWGAGTPFADKGTFATEVQKGGLATMEVFAQELKANGLYVARSLSFDDVTYERMTHPLTPQQRAVYDEMAKAWQIVYANIQEALAITGANQNGQAKGNARAKFYSAQQRFFSQVLTALQMPTVLERIQQDLDAGHAVVIQLYNTNEAQQDRELERIEQEGGDLSEVDLSPKKILLEYLDKAYPTQQFETYTDEDGNERSRPVVDSEKRPVKNAEAEAAKQALLERFGAPGFLVPDGALEQIINTFGPDTVAEITGRSERIVRTRLEDGTVQEVRQKRSESLPMKEAAEFMADKRNILVFSNAGSTGQSFHADLTKKNQRRRMHYLVQPGWQADIAMQGLGRTHRTNQKSAPNYLLVSTDLNGHKRFISTIARRLSQLGALTRGQRQTSQGLFSEKDNLENSYARGALRQLILDLKRGPVEEFSWSDVTDKLGFDRLLDKTGNINESHLPTIPQFLNRILTLEYEVQNRMFTAFTDRMDRAIEMAAAKGELDTGLENYKAASVVLAKEQVVHADPQTKAETKLLTFDTKQEVRFHAFDSLRERSSFQGFYAGIKTGKVYGTFTGYPHIDEKGNVEEQIRLSEPDVTKTRFVSAKTFKEHYRKLTEKDARPRWEQIIRESPPFRDEPLHLLAGSLLRIWDRLPKSNVRVLRVTDEAGKKYVGRILKPDEVGPVLERLGVQGGERTTYTPADALEAMEAGQTVELANGWKIGPRLVGGETRFELIGDDVYPFRDELRKAGVQIESRQFKTRFFLPTDRAKDILESLTSTRPIIKIQRAKGGRAVPDFERSVSDEPSAPIFFSQAQRMIESKMPAKASAQQIMGILSPANGVKPDELKWIGLDDFLKTKESFTKNEVLDFITLNIQAGPNEKALREAERRGDSAAIGDALGGPATVHALPITESMKRSVTTAGQPLFQAARRLKAPSYEAFKEALAKAQPIGTSSHILVDSSKQYPKGLLSRLASAPYVQSLSDALSSVFDVLQRSLQSSKPDYSRITYRGLSPDDYYLGVNLDGQKLSASGTDPDAVILNPWVTSWYIQEAMRSGVIREADAVEYVAGKLLDTLLHEMTHRQIRTTHTDANAQAFSRHLDENYGIVGLDRLKSLQRQLMQALEDADALTHLDRDQREQERFWRQGARLPLQTFGGFAKSPRAGNRQNVAGEGTRGRTGPPTTLRGRPEDSTAPLGPGPAFQRRETKPVTPAPDVRRATELPVPRTPSTPAQLFDGFDLPSETTADLLRRRFQDKFIRVRRTQEAIQQAGGLVPEKTNVYLAEELFHGRVETRLKLFEKEYVKPLVHAITTNGLTLSQVEEYLYARHAPERNAKIAEINPKFRDPESPGSGMTNDEAAAVLQGFDEKGLTPALEEVSGYVDDLNTERLRIIEEAGLETPETVQTWRDAYHYYVPLKGRADLEERPRTGKGFDIRGKESQRALGRKSLAKNLLAHTVAQAEETIVRAEKNRVGERFLNLARRYQNPKLWEINRTNLTPYFDERSGEVRYRKDQRLKLADNVLSVKQDGKAYLITIHDKALAAAMKNLGVERSGMIVRGLAAVNHYLAIVNTGGNPEFVLSNFDRDAQTAAIHLSGEQSTKMAAQVMASLPKAMKGIALQQLGKPGGEWGRAYEDLQAAGGKVGFFGLRTLDEIQRELIATVRDAEGSAARTALKMIRGVKDLIFAANEVVENAARLAAFKVAQEHGFTTEAAASLAKNLTVNFNRKGELGPMMNALWLFYNAGLQGSVRMFQALKHPKVQAAALGIVLASVALSALNRAIGGDDEDRLNRYDKVPDGIKERNLILMRPDGSYFKLPLPYGYNIFHVLGQQMEAVLHGSKTPIEGSVTLFSAIWNAFNPLGGEKTLLQSVSPTITDPLVELSTNRDWTGRPIKPEQSRFELKKPESQLYWSSVSPTSKAIAQWLNEATGGSTIRPGAIDISPEVLDYLVGELTGGAGSFINRATNAVIKLSRGEEIPLRKIPFVRVFAGDPPEYRSAQDFFKFGEEVKRTMAEYEAVATTHTPEAEVFKRTHAPILSLRGPLREAERAIEELQARRRAVDASRWPDDRKEQERESIGQAIELRRKNFNRLYRTVIEEERPVASFAHEEQLLQRRLQRRERQAQRRFPDVIAPPAP